MERADVPLYHTYCIKWLLIRDLVRTPVNDHLSIKALAKLFTCQVRKTSGSKEFQSNDPYVLMGSHGVADLLESLRTNDSCSCIWAIASKVLSLLFCMMVIPVVQNNRS